MSKAIIRLPNERPASDPPVAGPDIDVWIALRTEDGIFSDASYMGILGPRHGYEVGFRIGSIPMPEQYILGWCYREEFEKMFQHHVSRGYVLPPGWLPIDEMPHNVRTCALHYCRYMQFIHIDGTIELAHLHAPDRYAGVRVWDHVDQHLTIVGYRITQPLERVEG